MEHYNIGENIRKFRRRVGLTQDELGDKVGVTWEMISRYERGQSSPLNKLDKIAEAFGISITELIDDKNSAEYSVPVFAKIPKNFSFEKSNTTLYYNCPKWLVKLDPEIFAVDSDLIEVSNLIPKQAGYLFISQNSMVEIPDLVLVHEKGELSIEKYSPPDMEPIGKLMMQEIIFADTV